ncbi:MAG: DUF1622 domain-containing protein [Phycisphaerae bacterium]
MEKITHILQFSNSIVMAACQFLAIVVLSIGIIKAMKIYLADVLTPGRSEAAIKDSRLELGHSFSLALGFLIGASILKTTFAPSWNDIGQLSAIVAIRTILNYFLLYELSNQSDTGTQKPSLIGKLYRRKSSDTQNAPQ